MKEGGLRPVEIWVPDIRSAAFQEEARRQVLAVVSSRREAEDQAFIDAVGGWG